MSVSTQPHYWFPAKEFGWGWALPNSWPGWLVLAAYAIVFAWLYRKFWLSHQRDRFWLSCFVAGATLLAVVYLTGEPPNGRWGG